MQDARDLLKTTFGFDDFRPGQAEIIESILNGEEALAIMPTGGGKSLCFQLPALMRDGVTLVISPLIALMRDQVQALRALGVEAGALTSANDEEENERIFSAIDDGRLKLLYLAPERLSSASALLRRIKVSFLAVDEALQKLEVDDPATAEIVKLRYFVGLTVPQAAEMLGISTTTASWSTCVAFTGSTETAQAIAYSETGRVRGKIIIDVDGNP